MRRDILAWQWSQYGEGHQSRRNLVLHAVTAPLFMLGTSALLTSPLTGVGAAVGGAALMFVALVAQGRGHREEAARPAPFLGPADFVVRFLAEQWVTFPRFVLSGSFARAWRAAGANASGDAGAR